MNDNQTILCVVQNLAIFVEKQLLPFEKNRVQQFRASTSCFNQTLAPLSCCQTNHKQKIYKLIIKKLPSSLRC